MSVNITRPIVGIENRTAQEVFDIMVARIGASPSPSSNVMVTPADQIIGQIEELFPNWRSYRDLVDCITCELHELHERAEGRL